MDDVQQDNVQGYPSQHEPTHKHEYFSSNTSSKICSPCNCPGIHVIPAPPPLYHEDCEHDGHDADDDMDPRTRPEDRRGRISSCIYPLSPSSVPSGGHSRTNISVQYCKPIRSPRWLSGAAGELKMTNCSTDEDKGLDVGNHNDPSNTSVMEMNETEAPQPSQMTRKSYTPSPHSPVPISITPGSLLYYSHYHSTPSSTMSSPAASRRASLSSSPSMFMLQGFLANHSNGHIMFRKPPKCPPNSDCFTLGDGQCDNILGLGSDPVTEPQNELEDEIEDDDEDDDLHDDRFLLLAQSPNSSEFDLGQEFFVTERQLTSNFHQADSPVFFNGFPLLQMAQM
ncbi:hypothetical protein BGZ51_001841 [Haplosporangium sp. Z 767]|nr:hypothetical protein BGZ51_001841 [Haplosporangium sp. Z 767]